MWRRNREAGSLSLTRLEGTSEDGRREGESAGRRGDGANIKRARSVRARPSPIVAPTSVSPSTEDTMPGTVVR